MRQAGDEGAGMSGMWWVPVAVVAALGAVASAIWFGRRRRTVAQFESARSLFHRRREWLEADFLKLASENCAPRGLTWADCDFDDEVVFATDRISRQLRAFVAVTIRLCAVAPGGEEHRQRAGHVRAATAVFHFEGGRWQTEGRTIFNLNPRETVDHFQHELQLVE